MLKALLFLSFVALSAHQIAAADCQTGDNADKDNAVFVVGSDAQLLVTRGLCTAVIQNGEIAAVEWDADTRAENEERMANKLYFVGSLYAAERHFLEAIRLNNELMAAHFTLAFVLHRRGDGFGPVHDAYEAAFEKFPDTALAISHSNYAVILCKENAKLYAKEIEDHFEKSIEKNPDDEATKRLFAEFKAML